MKGLMKTARGYGNVELRDIPEPSPGPNQVKIEVRAAGICGTDIHILKDEYATTPPMVMGHEFSGVIAEVGKGVARFKPGDRVISETYAYTCGECRYCRAGRINLCPDRKSIGTHVNGAFTKYLVVRDSGIHRIPESVDFYSAALCEPVSFTINGVAERTKVAVGDVVAVSGPGTIGLIATQVAKAMGAIVIVCGTASDEYRLSLARELGADATVNVEAEDPVKVVKEWTGGLGADIVIESSGAEASVAQCINMARKGAQYTQLGLFSRPVTFDLNDVALKEIQITGVFAHQSHTWEKALNLISRGVVRADRIVSSHFPLEEWKKGFDSFGKGKEIKMLIIP